MTYEMYTLYDSCSQSYNNPFYFLNDNIAKRAAIDLLKRGETEISNHPEDFTMFKIGQYDPQTAEITIYDTKIPLIRMHELAANLPAEEPQTVEQPQLKEA